MFCCGGTGRVSSCRNETSHRAVPALRRRGADVTLLTQTKAKGPRASMCTALSDGEGRAAAGKLKPTSGSRASATREQPSGGGGMATRTTAQHALGIETASAERPCKVPDPGSSEPSDDDEDERGEEPAARAAMPNGPDARAKKGSGSIAAEPGKRAHGGTPPEATRAATLAIESACVAARGITGSRTRALTIWTADR